MIANNIKLVFIGGYMHSGTTMLKNLIGNSNEVFSFPAESRYWEYYYKNQDVKSLTKKLTEQLFYGINAENKIIKEEYFNEEDIKHLTNSTLNFNKPNLYYQAIAEYFGNKYQKKIVAEKTPTNVYFIQDIQTIFPESKVIVINRDIRDIFYSKFKRTQSDSRFDSVQKKIERDANLLADCLSWKQTIRKSLTYSSNPNLKIIKYEDFVSTPEKEMKEISDFLDINYSEELLKVNFRNSAHLKSYKSAGIDTSSVDKWKSQLKEYQIAFIQNICKNELKNAGYTLIECSLISKAIAYLLYFTESIRLIGRIFKRILLLDKKYLAKYIKSYIKRF